MNIRTVATFVISLAAAGTVSAQDALLRANIPFNFVINGKTLPAGDYTVRQNRAQGTVVVRAADSSVGVLSTVLPTVAPFARAGNARLVFHVSGDRYFLEQIWEDASNGSELPKARYERELAAHGNRFKEIVVAAIR